MATLKHMDTLARTLYGESKPNDVADAEAIASVIMNRKRLPNWPDEVTAVCLQPYQFSCWNVSDPNRKRIMEAKGKWFEQCKDIADRAIMGRIPDPTTRSTHYHTPAVNPKWSKGKKAVYKTNGHLFFNDIDTKPPVTAKEALDQKRPLSTTRGMKGGAITGAGITLSAAADIAGQVQTQVEPLVVYSDVLKYVFIAVALIGVGVTVYARWDDRRKGRV
jgi:N-acetylmuramoyl-L-alanine amidase